MNLLKMLTEAAGGQGLEALGRQHGASAEQALGVAQAALPALSSGLKRMTGSPDGMLRLAGLLRSNDAAGVADAPEADQETAERQGAQFLDTLFGDARPEIEREIAADGAKRSGLDLSTVSSMLSTLASMVLGMFQKQESGDSGLGGLVSSILAGGGSAGGSTGGLGGLISAAGGLLGGGGDAQSGGGQSGGFGLDSLTAMFDADGDGSAADDLLDRFMKR